MDKTFDEYLYLAIQKQKATNRSAEGGQFGPETQFNQDLSEPEGVGTPDPLRPVQPRLIEYR